MSKMRLPVDELCNNIVKSNCSKCQDIVKERRQIVTHRGNPNADVVIIGRNPGAQEDEIGKPFMGPAGQLLDNIITSTGYKPNEDFFLSNSVLCYTRGNRVPTDEEMVACSTHLHDILSYFDTIVATGKFAALAVMYALDKDVYAKYSRKSATALLTKNEPYTISSKKIYVTYHPSYLLRQGKLNSTYPEFNDFAMVLTEAKLQARRQETNTTSNEIGQVAPLF